MPARRTPLHVSATQVSPPPFALSARRSRTRSSGVEVVALPVHASHDGTPVLGPGAAEAAARRSGSTCSALLELAPGAPARAARSSTVPVAGRRRTPTSAWCCWSGSATRQPDDLRRAGAALARRDVRPRSRWPPRSRRAGRRRGAHARSSSGRCSAPSASTGARRAPSTSPYAGSCSPAWPTTTTRRPPSSAASRSAAPAGAPGCWPRCPSNVKNPHWLAEQAADARRARPGSTCEVWDEKQLAEEGFGGIVGVGQASATPAAADPARLHARRGGRKAPHVVLVGKGITFDTGGLSIKPRRGHDRR